MKPVLAMVGLVIVSSAPLIAVLCTRQFPPRKDSALAELLYNLMFLTLFFAWLLTLGTAVQFMGWWNVMIVPCALFFLIVSFPPVVDWVRLGYDKNRPKTRWSLRPTRQYMEDPGKNSQEGVDIEEDDGEVPADGSDRT